MLKTIDTYRSKGRESSTAALDSRVTLCAPHIPFLTSWDLYFKTSQWTEMDQWIEKKTSEDLMD